MATADITVRGAGIFGLSIAWVLTQRGARVQVIDPHGLGAGASGGIVGALAPHVPENWNPKKQFQLESLLMAEAFWTEVEAAGGQSPGYARTGRCQPIADDAALVLAHQRSETAKDLWGDAATWTVRPIADPKWSATSPTGMEIFDTLSARAHPRQACQALAAALKTQGVDIQTEGPDTDITLHATGVAGLDTLNAENPRMVGAGIKGQAALLDVSAPDAPQLFTDSLHIIPHADGTTAIGSTTEREYDDPASTDAQLDEIIARARTAVPALKDAKVIARWAGLRPRSRSRAPMLGPWPDRPGHFIANGGFKIGFGMAPKVAHTMADLILDGRDTIPNGFEVGASL
ncbi:FAD-binding oxidoreductase [Tateyamaria omphalii]|uniref:NAD(P)/FAD-dependent oxidoreductase n=1 Tax=Tateyamaria omphalii TaxID=299262 RepID=UPI001C99696E|nr:FAD-binding oxidoreductase [Tateyamaria omphalii]MBY5935367.1 FAD-binding oxidoreductase [Tateyamaria omphalii]